MEETVAIDSLSLLGFLAVFHLIGGGAVGIGLRRWRAARQGNSARRVPFLFLWGILFGALPIVLGIAVSDWLVVGAQAVMLLAAAAITFWFFEPLKEMLGHQYVFMIIFGGVFMISGAVASSLMLRATQEQGWRILLFGGVFFAIGTLVLSSGIVQWLKATGAEASSEQ